MAVVFQLTGTIPHLREQVSNTCERWVQAGKDKGDCNKRREFITNVEPVAEDLWDFYFAVERCRERRNQRKLNSDTDEKVDDDGLGSLCLDLMNKWGNERLRRYEKQQLQLPHQQHRQKQQQQEPQKEQPESCQNRKRKPSPRHNGSFNDKEGDHTLNCGGGVEPKKPRPQPKPTTINTTVEKSDSINSDEAEQFVTLLEKDWVWQNVILQKQIMEKIYNLCRADKWTSVLRCLELNPKIGVTDMKVNNHSVTTVTHQAITSKGDTQKRADVILRILHSTPQAAKIRNSAGSLPLHAVTQRNVIFESKTREKLMRSLIQAYPEALLLEGGASKRTPVHIIFTDYFAPHLVQLMIKEGGTQPLNMKDAKGYLPIHIACSRHCSPEKLQMLLEANPSSLTAKTDDGNTILSLAKATATKKHPNHSLIKAIETALQNNNKDPTKEDNHNTANASVVINHARLNDSPKPSLNNEHGHNAASEPVVINHARHNASTKTSFNNDPDNIAASEPVVINGTSRQHHKDSTKRLRKNELDQNESTKSPINNDHEHNSATASPDPPGKNIARGVWTSI